MIGLYRYELWTGKEVIGTWVCTFPIVGKYLIIGTMSELKGHYNKRYEKIKVPVTTREVSFNGVDRIIRIVLDVSKKSKRQRKILGAKE